MAENNGNYDGRKILSTQELRDSYKKLSAENTMNNALNEVADPKTAEEIKKKVIQANQNSGIFQTKNANNNYNLQTGLAKDKADSELRKEIAETTIKHFHGNIKGGPLPKDRIPFDEELDYVTYGLENISQMVDRLYSEIGKTFTIVTNEQAFSIELSEGSIPHLFALLSKDEYTKNDTRLYSKVQEKINAMEESIKSIKQRDFLKIVSDTITEMKEELYQTYKDSDEYDKDYLGKIGFKVCSLTSLIDSLKSNDVNNITIFKANPKKTKDRLKKADVKKDTYLLVIPVKGDTTYCCLKIVKDTVLENINKNSTDKEIQNSSTYTIESDGIITEFEFENLESLFKFSCVWDKTDLSIQNLVFKTGYSTINKVNTLFTARLNRDHRFDSINKGINDNIKNPEKKGKLISDENQKIVAAQFNEIVNKNDSPILYAIQELINKPNKFAYKKELPLLLVKLYQSYMPSLNNSKDPEAVAKKEEYLKALQVLYNEFNNEYNTKFLNDIRVIELINACYSCKVSEIDKLLNSKSEGHDWDLEMYLMKNSLGVNINATLNIDSSITDLIHEDFKNNGSFAEQFISLYRSFEKIYHKIQYISINNINDAKEYIALMNNFYHCFELVQASVINLYSDFIDENTSIKEICDFISKYPNIANIVAELEYAKPMISKKELDKLHGEAKGNNEENKKYEIIIDEEIFSKYAPIITEIEQGTNCEEMADAALIIADFNEDLATEIINTAIAHFTKTKLINKANQTNKNISDHTFEQCEEKLAQLVNARKLCNNIKVDNVTPIEKAM